MSRVCLWVCWCYRLRQDCWGLTLWSGCATKSRSALFRRVPHLRRPSYGAGSAYLSQLRLTVHHIQGVKNECAD